MTTSLLSDFPSSDATHWCAALPPSCLSPLVLSSSIVPSDEHTYIIWLCSSCSYCILETIKSWNRQTTPSKYRYPSIHPSIHPSIAILTCRRRLAWAFCALITAALFYRKSASAFNFRLNGGNRKTMGYRRLLAMMIFIKVMHVKKVYTSTD